MLFSFNIFFSSSPSVKAGGVAPVFPGSTWASKTPADVGLDPNKLTALQSYMGGRGAVVRYGYMAYSWGNQSYRADLASADKPIYSTFLFKAYEKGKLSSLDQKIDTFEPCVDSINSNLGYKDRNITFRQMANQISGYGVQENPGTAFDYNDWQMALFIDTLFLKVWGAGSWPNVNSIVFYPKLAVPLQMQDSPTMNDPALKQGRVSISVRDFARFGLLYLRGGNWNGTQILTSADATRAVSSPVSASIPETKAVASQMCFNQRTIGSTLIPDDQANHYNSYSYLWWINGVTSPNYPHYNNSSTHRFWWSAPSDTYMACGHTNCKRGMAVIPSLDMVVTWNDTVLDTRGSDPLVVQNNVLSMIRSSVLAPSLTPVPLPSIPSPAP